MSGYVLSSEALDELDEIWGYIAQDEIEAADRWIVKLLDACEMLGRNPMAGHTRKDLAEGLSCSGLSASTSLSIEPAKTQLKSSPSPRAPATSPPTCAAGPEP